MSNNNEKFYDVINVNALKMLAEKAARNAAAAEKAANRAEAAYREISNSIASPPKSSFVPFTGSSRSTGGNKPLGNNVMARRQRFAAAAEARSTEGKRLANERRAKENANRARKEAIALKKAAEKAREAAEKAAAKAAANERRRAAVAKRAENNAAKTRAARLGAASAAQRRANKNANERRRVRLANEAKQWNAMVEALLQRPRGIAALRAQRAMRPLFGPENMRTRRKGNKPKRN